METRHLQPAERLVELKRGRIDAELVYPPPRDEQLVEQLVTVSPRYVLVGEKHHLAGERSLTFDQVEHETLPGRGGLPAGGTRGRSSARLAPRSPGWRWRRWGSWQPTARAGRPG